MLRCAKTLGNTFLGLLYDRNTSTSNHTTVVQAVKDYEAKFLIELSNMNGYRSNTTTTNKRDSKGTYHESKQTKKVEEPIIVSFCSYGCLCEYVEKELKVENRPENKDPDNVGDDIGFSSNQKVRTI